MTAVISKFQLAPEPLGILGTGRMGVRLATMFARSGRRVILGSRDRSRAERIVAELGVPGLAAGTYADAVAAPIILPAVFIRDGLFDLLQALHEPLRHKILIDITNPFNEDYSDFILPWGTSGAEEIQRHLPQTRLVGAFKNVWWDVFDAPLLDSRPSDVLVVGDDEAAKQAFFALADGTPFRYLDAGRLQNARTVERMTLLMGELGRRYSYHPRINLRGYDEHSQPDRADTQSMDRLIARTA